jgi:3-oxoacyl-[acyl-carrier protein] reductase
MAELQGLRALVTGGASGIGLAIALAFRAEGATVAVLDRTPEAPEELSGDDALSYLSADITDDTAVRRAVDSAVATMGGLDILVNNAGIGSSRPIDEIDEIEYDRLFTVNVKAPFFLVKQGAIRLRDGGRVINISSGLARTAAMPHNMAYAMTKGALDVFSRDLSKILGVRGIRVNSVAPGLVDTDNTAAFLHGSEDGWAQAEAYSALGRVGTPAEVADVVAFLASDEGRWVTGSWVDATGGSMP